MPVPGELRRVDDVPAAFAALLAERAPASVALSGGALARDCYAAVARTAPDWSGVTVFFGDERYVPVDHPDSNEGMARATLLDAARPAAVHSLAGTDPAGVPIEDAAARADDEVRAAQPIDLCHLGLGTDGHTASLFPGAPVLGERDRFVCATGDDLHPHPRLTFTYPAIARCRTVVVTVAGAAKRRVLDQIADGADLPAAHLRAARELVWLVG